MLDDAAKLKLEISETSDKLDLGHDVIEKDIYVTKIIHSLADLDNDYYRLIFQGGTCLSKAHHLILRMSEDCDFRMEAKDAILNKSREQQRKHLREFRHEIIKQLEKGDLTVNQENIRVRDEGRFMNFRIGYQSFFPRKEGLKEFLAIDFFLTDVKTPTERLPITTLIQDTLGNVVQHPIKKIDCVSVIETAAEKWIALTRRIATIKDRQYYNDPSLVRHLYDLCKINEKYPLEDKFIKLVQQLLPIEQEKFKNHNKNYYLNPMQEIKASIDVLSSSNEWQNNWNKFTEIMVYENSPLKYREAINQLKKISDLCLKDFIVNKTIINQRQYMSRKNRDINFQNKERSKGRDR